MARPVLSVGGPSAGMEVGFLAMGGLEARADRASGAPQAILTGSRPGRRSMLRGARVQGTPHGLSAPDARATDLDTHVGSQRLCGLHHGVCDIEGSYQHVRQVRGEKQPGESVDEARQHLADAFFSDPVNEGCIRVEVTVDASSIEL